MSDTNVKYELVMTFKWSSLISNVHVIQSIISFIPNYYCSTRFHLLYLCPKHFCGSWCCVDNRTWHGVSYLSSQGKSLLQSMIRLLHSMSNKNIGTRYANIAHIQQMWLAHITLTQMLYFPLKNSKTLHNCSPHSRQTEFVQNSSPQSYWLSFHSFLKCLCSAHIWHV